jgi:lysozyme family protein
MARRGSMARFNQVCSWVIYQEDDHEHPGITKNLGDGGMRTRLGVTERWFLSAVGESFFNEMPLPEAIVNAKRIFKKFFWDLFDGDLIYSDDVVAPMLSFSVNATPVHAVRALQTVLEVRVDGVMGPNTLFALNRVDGPMTGKLLRVEWANYYHAVVDANPIKVRDLNGWLNRASFPYPSEIPAFYLEAQ